MLIIGLKINYFNKSFLYIEYKNLSLTICIIKAKYFRGKGYMFIPKKYIRLRESLDFNSVFLGCTEINLFKVEELNEAQLGYRVDFKGNSLINEEGRNWKKTWLVIGYESCCGDPIFIDYGNKNFPVYTAMAGEGEWDGILIGDTFKGFIKSLKDVKGLFELILKAEEGFVAENDKKKVLEEIKTYHKESDISFWEDWIDQE